MNAIINIARIINNKKNPGFFSKFSFEFNTSQEVILKLEKSILFFISTKLLYNFVLLIYVSAKELELSLTIQRQFA